MYTYQYAICRSYVFGRNWDQYDLLHTPLNTVFRNYLKTYIAAIYSLADHEDTLVYIDLDAYRNELTGSELTVSQWLDSVGVTDLITVDALPTDKLASVHYENAVLRGYKIMPAKAGYQYPPETPLSIYSDLSLTRPQYQTDLTKLHTHCLMSVNGFYHRTDTDGLAAYILDGGTTASMKRCSHVGILSFIEIGSITQYSLKDTDIMPLSEGQPLSQGLIITLPEGFEGKTPIFIFGGYLVFPNKDTFYRNNDLSWVLQVKSLPLIERYFESVDEIDLSSIVLETPLENRQPHIQSQTTNALSRVILTDGLYSDDNIRAWLKLSQSFVAIVDTSNLYYDSINVRVSNLPGFITSYQEPTFPLIMGYGKQIEYSKIQETQNWALRVQDSFYKQYAFSKAPIHTQTVVSNQLLPWRQYQRTTGFLLNIRGSKATAT